MRLRRIGFGLLGLVVGFCFGQPQTRAGVITEESGFGFVQTDYAPGINIGANDPLTFNKFNPGSVGIPANAVLQSVEISFNWGFQSQLSASFPFASNPASSITINAFGGITIGRPDVTITSPTNDPSLFLFPTQTFQNTASFTSATPGSFPTGPPLSTYFHSLPPGYVVPPSDQPLQSPGSGHSPDGQHHPRVVRLREVPGCGNGHVRRRRDGGLQRPQHLGQCNGDLAHLCLPGCRAHLCLHHPRTVQPGDPGTGSRWVAAGAPAPQMDGRAITMPGICPTSVASQSVLPLGLKQHGTRRFDLSRPLLGGPAPKHHR